MIRGGLPFIALLAILAFAAAPASARDTDRKAAVKALERVERLLDGRGVRTKRELSSALAELAAQVDELSPSDRRAARNILKRPTDPSGPDQYTAPLGDRRVSCTANFCFHWVVSTADSPNLSDGPDAGSRPDYIDLLAASFERSHQVEVGELGWVAPLPDSGGPDALIDVYVADIGDSAFGYAAPEGGGRSRTAYLVVDDDYSAAQFPDYGGDPTIPVQATAAHEYNHVLQYRYDSLQDIWMFESTATWAEEKVFDAVNDYLLYVKPWAELPGEPLTSAGDDLPPFGDELKMYGSAIWNHWLDSKYGPAVVRQAWALSQATSVEGGGYAPGAYDRAIRDAGGPGFTAEVEDFTASTAEWDAANSGIREGVTFPREVMRSGALTLNGPATTGVVDHTAFALYDVPRTTAANLRLTGGLPAGTAGSIALVGFAGGTMSKVLEVLDADGRVTATLPDPGRFERVTAVVTNADTASAGFGSSDWLWLRDTQPFSLAVTDVEPPAPAPSPTPAPPPTAVAASLKVVSGKLPRLRRLARRGVLTLTATVNLAGRLTATATVDRAAARRLRVARRAARIGTGRRTARHASGVKVNVTMTRKARAGMRRQRRPLRIRVRVRFVPAGGVKPVTQTVSLRLRP